MYAIRQLLAYKRNIATASCMAGRNNETKPSEMCQFLPNSFAHTDTFIWRIVHKFYTEHGSGTAVLCIKFKNACLNELGVTREQMFAIFKFDTDSGHICAFVIRSPGVSKETNLSVSETTSTLASNMDFTTTVRRQHPSNNVSDNISQLYKY